MRIYIIKLNLILETSVDIDNNDLSYGFLLFDEFSDINNQTILIDTLLADNFLNLSYQIITNLISLYGDNNISGRWSVFATDGLDTTFADENRYITFDASSVLSLKGELLPLDYKLHQNYPNPFNPITSIKI